MAVVGRARAALPGVAIHADAIVGFPTEDEAAWSRSVDTIRRLDLAGLHVFRYSARPGTAATRMASQVDEPTKKRRAAELLAVAADARARWAAAHVGGEADVLLETRLDDGRWTGRAADYTLIAAASGDASAGLENAIARVRVDAIDRDRPDRATGTIAGLSMPDQPRGAAHVA